MANYRNNEDMIRIGAYVRGSHPDTDYAIDMVDRLNRFLCQEVEENCSIEAAHEALRALFEQA
jgi:flagellum-specific ATP synthase